MGIWVGRFVLLILMSTYHDVLLLGLPTLDLLCGVFENFVAECIHIRYLIYTAFRLLSNEALLAQSDASSATTPYPACGRMDFISEH